MNILYDHQKFSTQEYGGISRYFATLIQAIKRSPEFEYQLGVLLSNNHYLQNTDEAFHSLKKIIKNPGSIYKLNKLYNQYLLTRNRFDVFHPTYYDTYFIDKLKKPLVVTIHDMTYERLPEYFWAKDPLTKLKRLNIERADKIIAISETTKNDLIKYLNTNPDKIEVVYHGIDFETPLNVTPLKNIPEEYILFVGHRNAYKNFFLFLYAFQQLSIKHPDLKVILTGGGDLDIAELEFIQRLKLSDKILHINASDEELNYLYQQAITFVYPSLHEGFGLPILEAFMSECPIVLSDTECFREIAQDAALYFEPQSVDDLAATLEKVINSNDLRSNLIEAGKKRIQYFPLQKSVDETFEIYKKLV
ncbi:MAG: glycosyltransferase family 4 protein [Sphingobacteriaceae bacterium]|nr:glycosyltransferase family 4 protein [Sphingobacteriaceae bacterium]